MDELNRKLAGWCGFKQIWSYDTNGDAVPETWNIPRFTTDLTACFKWIVPKMGSPVIKFSCPLDTDWDCEIIYGYGAWSVGKGETPAQAFCLAAEKLD